MLATSEVVVEVKLPHSLLAGSGLTRQEASNALLRSYIISLYRQDRISSGKAASLLGVHRLTFIRMLAEEGVSYLELFERGACSGHALSVGATGRYRAASVSGLR